MRSTHIVFVHGFLGWGRAAGAEKVFRETASGARSDRAQLRRALDQLDKLPKALVEQQAAEEAEAEDAADQV